VLRSFESLLDPLLHRIAATHLFFIEPNPEVQRFEEASDDPAELDVGVRIADEDVVRKTHGAGASRSRRCCY